MNENNKNRARGKAEEIGGSAKRKVGRAIGNEQMEIEGAGTEAKGEARQAAAKAGERTRGAVEQVTGKAKRAVGDIIDNEQMEAEGAARELKGKARRKANE